MSSPSSPNLRPTKFVLDGEIVIPIGNRLSFNDLLMRIHPAASRVRKLGRRNSGYCTSSSTCWRIADGTLTKQPLEQRRRQLRGLRQARVRPDGADCSISGHARREGCPSLVCGGWQGARRNYRQASRLRIPVGRPDRNAEDQTATYGGLRRWRISICDERPACRFVALRPI